MMVTGRDIIDELVERMRTESEPLRYTALALFFSLLWASCFVVVKIALRFSPPGEIAREAFGRARLG